jgi:hypothetical protein
MDNLDKILYKKNQENKKSHKILNTTDFKQFQTYSEKLFFSKKNSLSKIIQTK